MDSNNNRPLKIAVIGAGIVGVSSAEWLRRDGHDVTLIDRQEPGEGTSYGNGGILAACAVVPIPAPGLHAKAVGMLMHRDGPLFMRWSYLPKLLPWLRSYLSMGTLQGVEKTVTALGHLLVDTVEQHQALAQGTPAEKWISSGDYLYLYRQPAEFDRDSLGWRLRREQGISGEPVDRAGLKALDPAIGGAYQFGFKMPNHGHVRDPGRYVKDLSRWFTDQGGHFLRAEVRDIRPGESGCAVTVDGETVLVDKVVLACGVWSTKLAQALGHRTKMESERGYHVEYVNPSVMPAFPYMLSDKKVVVTPMDGRLRIAGLAEYGGLDAPASDKPTRLIDRAAKVLYPGLRFDERLEWMGQRPSTVDSLPLLGPSPQHRSVYFAFGHQHIGLTAGPKSGRIIADLIAGRTTNFDLCPYAVGRFD